LGKTTLAPLSFKVLKKFRVIYGSVRQNLREIEQIHGISGSQLWILQEVENSPGIGISDLADCLCINQPICNQLVENLVIRGLLFNESKREDQGQVELVVTGTSKEILAHAPAPREGVLAEALNALRGDDLFGLDILLAEVMSRLNIKDDNFADKPLSDL
jgi:MarR family transcriptional regulator, organic hydroperoxide resistance regulator